MRSPATLLFYLMDSIILSLARVIRDRTRAVRLKIIDKAIKKEVIAGPFLLVKNGKPLLTHYFSNEKWSSKGKDS